MFSSRPQQHRPAAGAVDDGGLDAHVAGAAIEHLHWEIMSQYGTDMDLLLTELNPGVDRTADFEFTPDGDAEVEASADFRIPGCPLCGGVLKPDVVFFGESVPTNTVELAMKRLDEAEVLLVAGTSLSVNSGLRFARRASRTNKPIVIVNIGKPRPTNWPQRKSRRTLRLCLKGF